MKQSSSQLTSSFAFAMTAVLIANGAGLPATGATRRSTPNYTLGRDGKPVEMRNTGTVAQAVCGGSTFQDLTDECENNPDFDGAVVDNGLIRIGVNCHGQLNVEYPDDGCLPLPDPARINDVGLRFLPSNPLGASASTEPGCDCEGWGVGISDGSGSPGCTGDGNGYANEGTDGGPQNLILVSFGAGARRVRSEVLTSDQKLRIIHDYRPSSATSNLYECNVSIINETTDPQNFVYRRVMDWDIFPTYFNEYTTLIGGGAAELIRSSTDGFNTADPCSTPSGSAGPPLVDIIDFGPDDLGALFDFEFNGIPPGAAKTFRILYGAAESEAAADAARGAALIDTYSYGQPSCPENGSGQPVRDCLPGEEGPNDGTPNTYIFGFSGIAGGFCGDGTVDSGEQCDDGNNNDGDGCSATCFAEIAGCDVLEPKLDALEVKADDLKAEVKDIKAEIMDIKAEVKDQKAETMDIKAEIVDLKAETVDIKVETSDIKSEVVDIKAETVDVKSEIKDLKAETVDIKAETVDIKAETVDIKAEIKDLKAETVDIKVETVDIKAEIKDLKAETVDIKADTVDIKAEVKDIKAETIDIKAETVDIKAELKDLKAETVDIKAEMKDQKAETIDLKAETKDIKAELQDLKAETIDIKAELKALQLSLDGLPCEIYRLFNAKEPDTADSARSACLLCQDVRMCPTPVILSPLNKSSRR